MRDDRMRLLITGGCGFIGANLVALLSRSNEFVVRVLDNESLGRRENLDGLTFEFQVGDIREAGSIDAALEGIDAVVHLAADTRVVDSVANPGLNFDVNVRGTLSLLDGMRRRGIKRLVNASTGGAIIGETDGRPVDETLAPAPVSPYGASKLAVEGYCSAYSACYGISSVSLRFSNVYGPLSFHKGSVVAEFFKAIRAGRSVTIFGDGTQIRDYIFVEDICDGILAALRRPVTGPIQLGSGRPIDLNSLVDMIRTVTGREIAVVHRDARVGEIHATYCNVSRARALLGFEPARDHMGGLKRTWEWFQAQE